MKKKIELKKLGQTGLFLLLALMSLTAAKAANLVVMNTNDSGAGSLRAAITTANSNGQADTITFDASVFGTLQTITLTSGELTIGADGTNPGRALTITGPGRDLLTISGGNSSRIFLADLFTVSSISGMTLTGGNGTGGVSTVQGRGGAVYLRSCNSVTLNDLLITDNAAANQGGGMGGENVRTFRMSDSVVSLNSVNGTTGGPAGGGLYLNFLAQAASDSKLSNVEVSSNTSNSSNTGAFISSNKLEIADSVFDSNTYNGSGGGGRGGLDVSANDGRVRDTSITGNNSRGNGGGLTVSTSGGDGVLILERLRVVGNTVLEGGDGGGIFRNGSSGKIVLKESLVAGNTSAPNSVPTGGDGAGIYSATGPFDIINTTITGNLTSGTDRGNGGGIYNDGGDLRIINSTIANNVAEGGNDSTDIWRGGGGISTDNGATTTVQNSIIAGNTANLGPDVRGSYISNGFNIVADTSNSGGFGSVGDQLNVDPLLDAGGLQNNGGATQTIALQTGSPAVNNGSNALAVNENGHPLRFDQRGNCFNRFINGATDIGAFEFGAAQLSGADADFDFDGDCRADISIFRPGPGEWWYLRSSDGGNRAFQFGSSSDTPVPADFTGDGRTDVAFWRESTGEWFILRSEDSSFYSFPFGSVGDVPVPSDFDGDGRADPAIYRPSDNSWFILNSGGGTTITSFGASGDLPVPADYDGDGRSDLAIYRPSDGSWWLNRSTSGLIVYNFGSSTDITVPGDYTGDGRVDVAFFRPASGEWFVLRSEDASFFSFPFGAAGDVPAAGDYDGDGRMDAAVFRPAESTWYINGSSSGVQIIGFGQNGDVPLPSVYNNP
ncbi:MAG: choice-of-anchor Q domain-containing protein [Pyrinomonadaceae bacterium]